MAAKPDAGDEIRGTGGARKIRFAAKGKGKSGGVRVITFSEPWARAQVGLKLT
jgi:hypothetical protein